MYRNLPSLLTDLYSVVPVPSADCGVSRRTNSEDTDAPKTTTATLRRRTNFHKRRCKNGEHRTTRRNARGGEPHGSISQRDSSGIYTTMSATDELTSSARRRSVQKSSNPLRHLSPNFHRESRSQWFQAWQSRTIGCDACNVFTLKRTRLPSSATART